jgi:biopolymer transport protein ExbB
MVDLGFIGWIKASPYITIPLLFFSILLVAYTLERWWVFRRHARFNEEFWQRITSFVLQNRLRDAISLCEVSPGIFAKIFKAGIESSLLSRQDAEDAMSIVKEECQEFLRRRLGVFGTLSFISPLLGLVGTTMGIMRAFSDLSQSGSGGPSVVAAGISEALITTIAGMLVAVPSAIIYNYFSFKLRAVLVNMNTYSQRLLMLLFESQTKSNKREMAARG